MDSSDDLTTTPERSPLSGNSWPFCTQILQLSQLELSGVQDAQLQGKVACAWGQLCTS